MLILCIRFPKPLYWWEKEGRDCGRLRRFGDSDTKFQVRISNQLYVAEAEMFRTSNNAFFCKGLWPVRKLLFSKMVGKVGTQNNFGGISFPWKQWIWQTCCDDGKSLLAAAKWSNRNMLTFNLTPSGLLGWLLCWLVSCHNYLSDKKPRRNKIKATLFSHYGCKHQCFCLLPFVIKTFRLFFKEAAFLSLCQNNQ